MDKYEFLNDRQREGVFTTEGPVLILAGAGSGKTSVLTNRLGYMLEEKHIDPHSIMAITFTNKAAKEMKERAYKNVGEIANEVWISTFHSTCVKILRKTAHLLGYRAGFTIYDADDSKTIIKDIFKKMTIRPQKGEVKKRLSNISKAKRHMLNPTQYALEVKDDYDLKQSAILYREYQSVLYKNNAMDFDDLIFNTILVFRRYPKVLAEYQELFHYIMVDEYQDTDMLQFELISKIADKYKNICVVGDDDQSIYKFRGADIRNILDFESNYPNTKVIKLEENYRSVGNILKAANSVVSNNVVRKDKSLWTSKEDGSLLHYNQWKDAMEESKRVIQTIQEQVSRKLKYSDFAILYRMNAQSRYFEEELVKANIPYEIAGGVTFYERKEIKDILAYLHVISNPEDDLFIKRVINVPRRDIGKSTIDKIQIFADTNKISFYQALQLQMESIPKIKKIVELIDSLCKRKMEMNIEDFTRSLLGTIHYVEYLRKMDDGSGVPAEDRIRNIHELLNKINIFEGENKNCSLDDFLNEVSLLSDVDSLKKQTDKVVLMTVHSAKGLEFNTVFMTGMEDGVFPMSQCMYDAELLEEERRLAYVAITRARKELFISCASKRMINGKILFGNTSVFISEIPQNLLTQPVLDRKISTENEDNAKMFIFKKQIEKRTLYPCKYTCLCGGITSVNKVGEVISCECGKCHFSATNIISHGKDADYIDDTTCIAYVAGSYNHISQKYGSGVLLKTISEQKLFKAVENKPYMLHLKELAGEMNAVIFAANKAISLNMSSITIRYITKEIEALVTGDTAARNDEMQRYVQKILALRNCIRILFVKCEESDNNAAAAQSLADKVVGNLEKEVIAQDELERKAIAYGVDLRCIEQIRKFNTLKVKLDEDYLKIKTYGLDQLSQYSGIRLRQMISIEELAYILQIIDNPKEIDTCIRWIVRGLSIEDAIKKTTLSSSQLKNI